MHLQKFYRYRISQQKKPSKESRCLVEFFQQVGANFLVLLHQLDEFLYQFPFVGIRANLMLRPRAQRIYRPFRSSRAFALPAPLAHFITAAINAATDKINALCLIIACITSAEMLQSVNRLSAGEVFASRLNSFLDCLTQQNQGRCKVDECCDKAFVFLEPFKHFADFL